MARKRSYFAGANRGKTGEVFINNVIAHGQAKSKQRAKDAASAQKKTAREAASREKARAKDAERARKKSARDAERWQRERAKERERLEKEAARKEKEKARADKKFQELLARSKLVCTKLDIHQSLARELATKAFEASLTGAALERDLVKPSLRKWQIYGAVSSIKKTIAENRIAKLRASLERSSISVAEVLGSPRITQEQNYKILVDHLEKIWEEGELLADDYEQLQEAAWPPLELDSFITKHEIEEKKDRKRREDFLIGAVSRGEIMDDSLETLVAEFHRSRVDPALIEVHASFKEAKIFKEQSDTTQKTLKSIYGAKALRHEDYFEFEEYVETEMFGENLAKVTASARYKELSSERLNDVDKIEALEKRWIPGSANSDQMPAIADPNRAESEISYLENFQDLEFLSRSQSKIEHLITWLLFGFLGTHRFWAGRPISGGLLLLLSAVLLWHGGPKLGETGLILGIPSQVQLQNGEIAFDQIALLNKNANVRLGPSTSFEIAGTLAADDGTHLQVLKSNKDSTWYEVREIRSILSFYSDNESWTSGITQAPTHLVRHLENPDQGLMRGHIFHELLDVNNAKPTSIIYAITSTEVFLLLLLIWTADGLLILFGAKYLKSKSKTRVSIY